MNINEIELRHIENLEELQLSKLLHSLLQIELKRNSIQGTAFVPFNINTGDGGEDGRVSWIDGIDSTKWLKNRFCFFQNKATVLGPTACYEEILRPKVEGQSRKLKDRVDELILAKGCYVLFTNISLTTQQKSERIDKFREAIRDAEHTNFEDIQIEVYDANSIKDWVNENIATITLVQSFNDITRPGFKTWEDWKNTLEGSEIPFKTDDKINQNIQAIRESINLGIPVRIIGHSGIGKTRLVLEAFENTESTDDIAALLKQVVYFEMGVNGNLPDLSNYILSHTKQTGILVIDSCDEDAHKVLSGLVSAMGYFKLITIDIGSSTNESRSLKIERTDQRVIVREIITDMLGETHRQSDIDYLNNICEGYPWMAVRFCKSIRESGIDNFNGILPSDFIPRLLFNGNETDKLEYNVIRACAVFSTFGFLDDDLRPILNHTQQQSLEEQMEFIRINIYSGQLTSEQFYEICQKYKRADIIEKRGTQYMVKPTILAINLASDWLLNTPPSKIINILTSLKGSPLGLKFVERLKDLDQIDKAQKIVHELWGPNSPFGSAEVLNSSWGSLLFRYVVEVNPISTAKTLQTVFGGLSKEEVSEIFEARRNLVWALEKLCFRKQAFPIAAKVLYSFAVSENETWGNNATNQFIQLYQLFLSGTEASLQERLAIISYGLSKNDSGYNRVAILALGRGLSNDRYVRIGGADKQGSSAPLIDYSPDWDEIFEFWDVAIQILVDLAINDTTNSELAKEKLSNSFRTLIRDGKIDLVVDAVMAIRQNSTALWSEALNSLKTTIQFEQLNAETIAKVELLIDSLKSEDVKDQLLLNVTQPEWFQFDKDDEENLIDRPKINAEKFANRLIDEEIEWLSYLPNLLQGEQRQGFNFGYELGKRYPESKRIEFINLAFQSLDSIPEENRNIDVIGGFIKGVNNDDINSDVLDRVLSIRELNKYAFYLVRILDVNTNNLNRLFEIIDDTEITVSYFKSFQYGRALESLPTKEIIELCQKIEKYGIEGRWVVLSLIFMYTLNDLNKWNGCKYYLVRLISDHNMIISTMEKSGIDSYHWSNCVEKLLNESDSIDFAIAIANQIVEFCEVSPYNYSYETYIRIVLNILLEKYFDFTWPILGQGLIGNPMTYLHMKNLLNPRNGSWEHPAKLFADQNHNLQILKWMRQNIDTAPKRIANMMPLQDKGATEVKWHPFTKTVIDEFGNQERVLRELSANMGTFGSVGSSIPYYERQKKLLESLLDHPSYQVKEWAERMIDFTNEDILREKLNDEEDTH